MLDCYKQYWQGKSPTVRKAVEDYLGSDQDVKTVAAKYGVSIVAVVNNAKRLKYLYHVGRINLPEILCRLKTEPQQVEQK